MHDKIRSFTNRNYQQTNKQREILELKNTMTELNYSLELQKQTWYVEKRISDLKGRTLEITQVEEQKGKIMKKHKESPWGLWDTVKKIHVHSMGILK